MKIYFQLLIIFGFSFVGDTLSNSLHLPVPGSILGMIFLFLALQFKVLKFTDVDEVGSFLINNMTILFLPAGVGLMAKWSLISDALIVNVFVLGHLVQFIKVKYEGDYLEPELLKNKREVN